MTITNSDNPQEPQHTNPAPPAEAQAPAAAPEPSEWVSKVQKDAQDRLDALRQSLGKTREMRDKLQEDIKRMVAEEAEAERVVRALDPNYKKRGQK